MKEGMCFIWTILTTPLAKSWKPYNIVNDMIYVVFIQFSYFAYPLVHYTLWRLNLGTAKILWALNQNFCRSHLVLKGVNMCGTLGLLWLVSEWTAWTFMTCTFIELRQKGTRILILLWTMPLILILNRMLEASYTHFKSWCR